MFSGEPKKPYVARLDKIYVLEDQVFVEARWYYRHEDTAFGFGRLPVGWTYKERYLSSDANENEASMIMAFRDCQVKHYEGKDSELAPTRASKGRKTVKPPKEVTRPPEKEDEPMTYTCRFAYVATSKRLRPLTREDFEKGKTLSPESKAWKRKANCDSEESRAGPDAAGKDDKSKKKKPKKRDGAKGGRGTGQLKGSGGTKKESTAKDDGESGGEGEGEGEGGVETALVPGKRKRRNALVGSAEDVALAAAAAAAAAAADEECESGEAAPSDQDASEGEKEREKREGGGHVKGTDKKRPLGLSDDGEDGPPKKKKRDVQAPSDLKEEKESTSSPRGAGGSSNRKSPQQIRSFARKVLGHAILSKAPAAPNDVPLDQSAVNKWSVAMEEAISSKYEVTSKRYKLQVKLVLDSVERLVGMRGLIMTGRLTATDLASTTADALEETVNRLLKESNKESGNIDDAMSGDETTKTLEESAESRKRVGGDVDCMREGISDAATNVGEDTGGGDSEVDEEAKGVIAGAGGESVLESQGE
eukprot:Rmarinus@m.28918